jgi:small subunit ribosomal protein S1
MSTEETISNIGAADQNESSTEMKPAETTAPDQPTATVAGAQGSSAAVASQRESDEEARPPGEDFGSMLDQFEQEQSALQEGEVVRGTVVGITERGVVIDFGYKSEGIVDQNEFMEDGQIVLPFGVASSEREDQFQLRVAVNMEAPMAKRFKITVKNFKK